MSARPDDKNACLAATTLKEGGTDDLERTFLQTHVGGPAGQHINDLWLRFFWLNGAVSLDYNDAAYEYLTGLGYSGKIDDMWSEYWKACPISLGPLKVAGPKVVSFSDELEKQNREHLAAMEKRKAAQQNLIAERHREYDKANIPRGLSLEERHAAYVLKGLAPGIKLDRIKVSEGKFQPPDESSCVTRGTYGAVCTGFREPIHEIVFSCEGGRIIEQLHIYQVVIETDSDSDTEFTLNAHAVSKHHEGYGTARFTHRHHMQLPPVVTIEQVEEGVNGFRPPNKRSKCATQYKARYENFRKLVKRFEWAVEGAEIIEGEDTDTVTIQTDGAGEVPFTVHCVIENVYSTADFTHQHPKLESFAALKEQHQGQQSGVQGGGTG